VKHAESPHAVLQTEEGELCAVSMVDPERVASAQQRMPSVAETDRLAEWFKVLGDPTRARLLYALLEAGELCVCDLAATVALSETTVSHSLRWLRTAGMVRVRRGGRMMFYSLDDGHVRMLLELGREHLHHS
jgi:ArsR family transcriptional regulator, lead/cadmium/zinc/bismuth-responsive transcriptional repressor